MPTTPSNAKTGWCRRNLKTPVPSQRAGPPRPGPERLLAGLVNIVPELAKPGETQGLVGHEPGPVIDHEDKSAGQKQQADKPEQTADHASPYICRTGEACRPIPGHPEKFNLISILCPVSGRI